MLPKKMLDRLCRLYPLTLDLIRSPAGQSVLQVGNPSTGSSRFTACNTALNKPVQRIADA